jgi:hypothetical protein
MDFAMFLHVAAHSSAEDGCVYVRRFLWSDSDWLCRAPTSGPRASAPHRKRAPSMIAVVRELGIAVSKGPPGLYICVRDNKATEAPDGESWAAPHEGSV